MLEDLEGRHEVELLARARLESTNKQVLAKWVVPTKIKSPIPHEPHKESIAAAEVQKAPAGIQTQRDDRLRDSGQKKIPPDQPNIARRNRIAVSLIQPSGLLRLNEPTTATAEIVHRMAAEHDRLGKRWRVLLANAAIHGRKMRKPNRKSIRRAIVPAELRTCAWSAGDFFLVVGPSRSTLRPMLKISVVTACWNFGSFIGRALESVASQGWEDYEHIVIDNCSTDNTAEIVKKYPNVRFISEPDRGQSDAINKGFRLATGDVIAWLNADEYYLPDTFKTVMATFAQSPDLDVLYGDAVLLHADGKPWRRKCSFDFSEHLLKYYGCFLLTCTTFLRRRFVDENILLDESLHFHMDHDFFLRLMRADFRFRRLRRFMGCFCVHVVSKTSNPATLSKRMAERELIQTNYCRKFSPDPALNRLVYLAIMYALKTVTFPSRALNRALPPPRV